MGERWTYGTFPANALFGSIQSESAIGSGDAARHRRAGLTRHTPAVPITRDGNHASVRLTGYRSAFAQHPSRQGERQVGIRATFDAVIDGFAVAKADDAHSAVTRDDRRSGHATDDGPGRVGDPDRALRRQTAREPLALQRQQPCIGRGDRPPEGGRGGGRATDRPCCGQRRAAWRWRPAPSSRLARRSTMPLPNVTRARRSSFHRGRHRLQVKPQQRSETNISQWLTSTGEWLGNVVQATTNAVWLRQRCFVTRPSSAGDFRPELCPIRRPRQKSGATCSTEWRGSACRASARVH